MSNLESFIKLKAYCEAEDFAGWDPYDGLNSKLFKAIPFAGHSAVMRLIWIQLFKRNPLNLRAPALVAKERNAKGIGLFLSGYCNLYQAVKSHPEFEMKLGSAAQLKTRIIELADWLVDNRSDRSSGAAWGYNFPWQCRREFLFPAHEPTVVATYFCASALFDAYEITKVERYLQTALSAADFVKNDLRRTPYGDGVIISYSKMPGNDTIYNASLLGSALLARCYSHSGDKASLELAKASMEACCGAQQPDGSWTYGVKSVTGWIDSFHTGYNLMAIREYMDYTGDLSFEDRLEKGLRYYVDNFFMADGTPKYYHNQKYPIDIHCPGQLVTTLNKLGKEKEYSQLIDRVLDWTMRNMQSDKGYFYYQYKKGINSKISYMRWSNAFMFNALSFIIR